MKEKTDFLQHLLKKKHIAYGTNLEKLKQHLIYEKENFQII